MARFSTELLNKLTEFLICEIGAKALSGITYTLLIKGSKDDELYERYLKIKKEAKKCGYDNDEVFRIYQVSNGYILDMDLNVAKRITAELNKAVAKTDGKKLTKDELDLIGEKPNIRRVKDMERLARYVISKHNDGQNVLEVALFSRNSVPRIIITAEGPNGEELTIGYNAFAIRHWDLEYVNSELLIPEGLRVYKMTPLEVLPSRTGVSFRLYTEEV